MLYSATQHFYLLYHVFNITTIETTLLIEFNCVQIVLKLVVYQLFQIIQEKNVTF